MYNEILKYEKIESYDLNLEKYGWYWSWNLLYPWEKKGNWY